MAHLKNSSRYWSISSRKVKCIAQLVPHRGCIRRCEGERRCWSLYSRETFSTWIETQTYSSFKHVSRQDTSFTHKHKCKHAYSVQFIPFKAIHIVSSNLFTFRQTDMQYDQQHLLLACPHKGIHICDCTFKCSQPVQHTVPFPFTSTLWVSPPTKTLQHSPSLPPRPRSGNVYVLCVESLVNVPKVKQDRQCFFLLAKISAHYRRTHLASIGSWWRRGRLVCPVFPRLPGHQDQAGWRFGGGGDGWNWTELVVAMWEIGMAFKSFY